MRLIIILIISFLVTINIFAQRDFDTMYVKIKNSPSININQIRQEYNMYNSDNKWIYVKVDEAGLVKLQHSEYVFKAMPNPGFADKALTMATSISEMSSWDRYPTFDVYNQMMLNFQTDFPQICKIDTIGFSEEGRVVLCAKISDNINTDENEPEVFLTGQMHGDELVTYIVFLHLIDDMLNQYGSDSQITNLVNNVELYINPLSNPDGTYAGGDNTVSGAVRLNANNIDLNRSFPIINGGNQDSAQWPAEVKFMIDYANLHDFVLSANSHSGAEVINYPWDRWDSSTKITADNDWWIMISQHYANLAQTEGSADNYFTDVTPQGYTNGGDWYVVNGSRQDYMNYYKQCREVTLELSGDKALDASLLPSRYQYNKQALLDYIQESLYGIRGVVTDACTNIPIKAKIEVLNHDFDNSFVYSSLPVGNYHRLIKAGTYDLMFTASGYDTLIINNVSVTDGQATVLNVQLSLNNNNLLSINTEECIGNTEIIANNALNNVLINFGDDNNFYQGNYQTHIYSNSGNYDITMIYTYCGNTDTVTENNAVSINLLQSPDVESADRCNEGDLTLTATPVNNGEIVWFDKNGNQISTGNTYNTGVLQQTDTFFVKETNPTLTDSVGMTEINAGGDFYNNNTRYLVFDVYHNLVLKSVMVNAGSGGVRTFVLKDSEGQEIYQTNKYVPAGVSNVSLNWNISVGSEYQILVSSSNPDLFRSDSGVNYPYEIPNIISIKNSSAGNDYYYFFYNWKIQYSSDCVSNLTPVYAVINQSPTAHFEYNVNMNTVDFNNTSTAFNSYSWDFGDGTYSYEENPSHTYENTGNFVVNLTAENSCETSTFTDTVTIDTINGVNTADVSKDVVIYPNPAKDKIYFKTKEKIKTVTLIDINGKKYKTKIENKVLDVSFLSKGIYIVKITTKKSIIIKNIIII